MENPTRDLERLYEDLEIKAVKIRKHIIESIYSAGSGHPGGSLSVADVLTALYFHEMRHDPKNPGWEDRDRLVLSKGHAAPALYAVLAEAGYFPVKELKNLRKMGHFLQGHPCMLRVPGVEMSTGSLGQGLSVGVGMALAGKIDRKSYRVFVVMGDGETHEGQVWEAASAAVHFKLDNLIGIIDRNGLQIDGPTEEIMTLEPVRKRWKAVGWKIIEIDGHQIPQILEALYRASRFREKPTMIIAHTLKGKGVSFMQGTLSFHGKAPSKEQYEKAMSELNLAEMFYKLRSKNNESQAVKPK
ncbi:MAG TPA: transketolase [Thermoplasmata archaeon]|nr:transketolase [Thermoplasmata archaeon]